MNRIQLSIVQLSQRLIVSMLNLRFLTVEKENNDRRSITVLMHIGVMSLFPLHVKVNNLIRVSVVNVESCFGMNFS